MSADRELLKMAAKAAGIFYDGFDEDEGCDIWWLPELSRFSEWNPLADDGDALRLAVKIKLNICFVGDYVRAGQYGKDPLPEGWSKKDDGDAATRYAIVRAAAEMGRRMS